MTELTEAEIERLCDWYENETPDWGLPTLLLVVADLIDARLAPIRALADQWNDTPDYDPSDYDRGRVEQRHDMTGQLLAALSAHESAPQAGGGAGSHLGSDGLTSDERAGFLNRFQRGVANAHTTHRPEETR